MCHYNKYYFGVLLENSALLVRQVGPARFRSSQESNINSEAPPSFVHTLLKQFCKGEKDKCARQKEEKLSWGFTLLWLSSILRKFCVVFSLVVSPRKIFVFLCSCVSMLVVLSVILLVKIVLRYHLSNLRKLNRFDSRIDQMVVMEESWQSLEEISCLKWVSEGK